MAKRRFLTLAAIVSFLIALLSLEPHTAWRYINNIDWTPYLLEDSLFMGMGILCCAAFMLLICSIFLAYRNMSYMPVISTLFSGIAATAIQTVLDEFQLLVLIFAIIPVLLSAVAVFLPAQKLERFPYFSIFVVSIMGLFGRFIIPDYAEWTEEFGISLVSVFFLVMLVGGFFTLFSRKVQEICFHIFVGLMALSYIILFIVGMSGGFMYHSIFFMLIFSIVIAALYYIVSFVPACRKFLEKFNGAEADGPQPPPAAAKAAAGVDPLDALEELQKLREAGALTEEEFAAQKNKILGGM